MLNLKSQVFELKDGLANQRSIPFSKTWSGGGVFGVIHLDNDKLDLEKIGKYLSQSALDLVMNSVEDDRIKLLDSILHQLKDSSKTVFTSEGAEYDDSLSVRVCILLFLGENVYIGLLGKSGCYMGRGEKILNFSSLVEDASIKVISGKVGGADLFLLSPNSVLYFPAGFETSANQILENFSMVIGDKVSVEEFANAVDDIEEGISVPEQEESEDDDKEESGEVITEEEDMSTVDVAEEENVDLPEDDLKEMVVDEDFQYELEEVGEDSGVPMIGEESRFKSALSNASTIFRTSVLPFLKKALSKFVRILGSVGSWVFETIVGFGGRSKYKTESTQRLKFRRILLIVCIILFGVGLFLSVRWIKSENATRELQEHYTAEYSRIENTLSEATSMASYNAGESRNMLLGVITDAEKLSGFEVENNSANQLAIEAKVIVDQIEKRVRLADPNVIADLKIEYENAELDDLILFDNNLWVSDSNSSVVYRVSPSDGTATAVFGRADGLSKPAYLEAIDDTLYIYDAEEGLFSAKKGDDGSYTLSSVTGLNPTTLGDVTEIAVYENDGSLYFLVSSESKVKKSSPVGSGFSYPQVRAEDPLFSNAEDIEITHVIYTLGDGGNFMRFEDNIEISDEVGELTDTGKFDLFAYSYAIILDRAGRRVVLLKQPEGGSVLFKMEKQFAVQEGEERFFNDLKEVAVDVANNRLYILDGFRIIEIDIDE